MALRRNILTLFSLPFLMASHCFASDDAEDSFEEDKVPVVVLAALDKITTQLSTIEIEQDQSVRFGTLEITLRQCRKTPPEDPPETVAFLEVTDIGHNNQKQKVFMGWMFASSPALSPLEHPVYDVWVKDCKMVSGPESTERE